MSGESASFLWSLVCGVMSMLLWDILFGVRQTVKCGIAANILLDTIWWSVGAMAFAWCLWSTNDLALRGFNIFALVLSGVLYHITVSRYIKRLNCIIFNIFFKIIKFILKILLTPAVFLYKILVRPFKNLCKKNAQKSPSKTENGN